MLCDAYTDGAVDGTEYMSCHKHTVAAVIIMKL